MRLLVQTFWKTQVQLSGMFLNCECLLSIKRADTRNSREFPLAHGSLSLCSRKTIRRLTILPWCGHNSIEKRAWYTPARWMIRYRWRQDTVLFCDWFYLGLSANLAAAVRTLFASHFLRYTNLVGHQPVSGSMLPKSLFTDEQYNV